MRQILAPHLAYYANGLTGWVEEVFVRRQDRGHGIGPALMSAFEQWAAAQGCALIALATRRAAPFYRALGYEESAVYLRKVLDNRASKYPGQRHERSAPRGTVALRLAHAWEDGGHLAAGRHGRLLSLVSFGGMLMRAIWITRAGGPEALQVRETADCEAGPGQVRIRVRAAGLNFADVMAAQGLYPDAPKRPCVVGYEAAGVVDALGDGVPDHAVGQRVVALTHFGGHADVVSVPAQQVFQIPDEMSFEEAAALPVNYLTAYHMLFRVACVRPGERVLVHMAAGGVGTAVLQLCRTVEGLVVFGTASAGKHEMLRSEGCAHPIDYRAVDYAAEVRRLTGGEGVDVVLDPLGGNDWRKGLKLLRPCGRLVAFGFANLASGQRRRPAHVLSQAAGIPLLTPLQMMNHNRTVSGVNIGRLWGEIAILREEFRAVLALWDAGSIKPHIDAVYPFTEAAAAHRRILQRQNIGKIVLTP